MWWQQTVECSLRCSTLALLTQSSTNRLMPRLASCLSLLQSVETVSMKVQRVAVVQTRWDRQVT